MSSATRASAPTAWARARRAGAIPRVSTRPSSICWRTASSAAERCACAPRARCSTRKPRDSSRATTAIATKTSRKQSQSRGLPRCFERARLGAFQPRQLLRTRLPLRSGRHLPPLAHGFHPALPDRQAVRAQRADQLHAERHLAMNFFAERLDARVSLDAETADSRAHRVPAGARDRRRAGGECASARPDFTTTTASIRTLGATLALRLPLRESLVAAGALRADTTHYDYDNHMIDGNTAPNGVPCPGGCLYSRPADRSDTFDNLAPRVTLSWQPGRSLAVVPVSGSTGFRPPEMTEVVPTAAPADGRRSRQRGARIARGRLEVPHRSLRSTPPCST